MKFHWFEFQDIFDKDWLGADFDPSERFSLNLSETKHVEYEWNGTDSVATILYAYDGKRKESKHII